MRILQFLRQIKKALMPYQPSIVVKVSRERLLGNLAIFQQKYPQHSFAPVLKSNAYGHGLLPVARILAKQRLPFFVLDSLFEAMVLRGEAISTSILVIGYTSSENIKNCRLKNIAFTITSLEQLQTVAELVKRPTKIHLKIDTGMHRQGILLEQTAAAIELIKANNYLILEGLCSHLADADGAEENFTLQQIERWNKIVNEFEHAFSVIKYVHLAASAGAFYLERARGNVARLGLALYGVNPSAKNSLDLQPALQIESVISSVKKIPAGEGVGYNLTHVLKETGLVATVPVGYYEAVDRRLSNIGSFLVNGQVCPIVGRVSMNITIIDVTALPEIKLGDSVVVTSWDPEAKNSLENQARLAGTIPYELMVHITPHLHREVV